MELGRIFRRSAAAAPASSSSHSQENSPHLTRRLMSSSTDDGPSTTSSPMHHRVRDPPSGSHSNSDVDVGGVEAAAAAMANDGNGDESMMMPLVPSDGSTFDTTTPSKPSTTSSSAGGALSKTGLQVLVLLAVQNCSKTLLVRYVMDKDAAPFLTSTAVLGSETLKLTASVCYIVTVERRSLRSIAHFLRHDVRNTVLLAVPASAYNLQMSLEYVALANLNAALFAVLVQSKLVFTATFAAVVLRKRLRVIQVVSLVLLTVGVMLCNVATLVKAPAAAATRPEQQQTTANDATGTTLSHTMIGTLATLGIAMSSGFASVYTEKVIKGTQRPRAVQEGNYGLAYTQVQLAGMSLVTMGVYAVWHDWAVIVSHGLFHNFTWGATLTVFNSALGGLIVAAVLKYADAVLKGYATAVSVILTGLLSWFLFGTSLNIIYFMGIVNVVVAVLLYNGNAASLDRYICE